MEAIVNRKSKIVNAMKRSGFADLPLHGGHVPQWLAARMTELGTAIVEAILHHYGHSEFLTRLADPFWFQALGSVMGMDWHSSGITTSVMGALKRGLAPRADELGIYICGGRGRHSRNTPNELRAIAERKSLDGDALVQTSRLTARIDNNAIADGFQIYLHTYESGYEPRADFNAAIAHEKSISRELGGRTVFDSVKHRRAKPRSKQLTLFDN